jgi:transcriptional regulator with XRE-family HTH domain
VIDVALLGIIRRWHLRDQVPLREIARRLGISRNTVRRYIRAETIEPAYADRRPRSSLDKYTLKLSAWLKTEAVKSRKQRRTLKQLHLELRSLGYEGSYDRVAAFARRWKVDQLERVNSASKSTRNFFCSSGLPLKPSSWLISSHNGSEPRHASLYSSRAKSSNSGRSETGCNAVNGS